MPEPLPSITSITICRPIFKKSKNVPGVLRMIWRNDIWMLQENKEPLYKFLFYIYVSLYIYIVSRSSKYIITFWQAFNDAFSSYIITMSPSFNSSKIRANSSQDTS